MKTKQVKKPTQQVRMGIFESMQKHRPHVIKGVIVRPYKRYTYSSFLTD